MLRLTATFTRYTVCYYPFLTRNHLRTDNADGYRALAFPRPNFLSLYILTNNGVQLHSSQQLRLTAEQLVELEHGGRESLLILFLHFSFLFLFFSPSTFLWSSKYFHSSSGWKISPPKLKVCFRELVKLYIQCVSCKSRATESKRKNARNYFQGNQKIWKMLEQIKFIEYQR